MTVKHKTPRPWYALPGTSDAYRSVKEQLRGLGPLWDAAPGKTVLDIGCAEGAMCHQALQAGAALAVGIEREPTYVGRAREYCASWGERAVFHCHDLNHGLAKLEPRLLPADVVLLLAVVHKLKQPAHLLDEACVLCRELMVIRLPRKSNGVINDGRSGFKLFDVPKHMLGRGFELERREGGPHEEPTLYFRRR